jgi:hypothetical protein
LHISEVEVAPLLERCGGRFAGLLAEEPDAAQIAALKREAPFIPALEQSLAFDPKATTL